MAESLIRVDDDLLEEIRKKYPELKNLAKATLVEVALRKLLETS